MLKIPFLVAFVAVLAVSLLQCGIPSCYATAVNQCSNSSNFNQDFMEMLSLLSRLDNHTHNPSHVYNIECGTVINRTSTHHNLISSCPWTHTHDRNHDRIPQDLTPAQCKCDSCRLGNETGVCRPFVKEYGVIIRRCENGEYNFYRRSEFVPIACVCVPKVQIG